MGDIITCCALSAVIWILPAKWLISGEILLRNRRNEKPMIASRKEYDVLFYSMVGVAVLIGAAPWLIFVPTRWWL